MIHLVEKYSCYMYMYVCALERFCLDEAVVPLPSPVLGEGVVMIEEPLGVILSRERKS